MFRGWWEEKLSFIAGSDLFVRNNFTYVSNFMKKEVCSN